MTGLKTISGLALAGLTVCVAGTGSMAQDWDKMGPITPRSYLCYQADSPIQIDGRLTDAAWERAAWTDEFVDIQGTDFPKPTYPTRARILWDDDYLYIGAWLEEPHVWGTLIERNAIIFYDNDFEVFIDPDGDNHNYYEFEVNALNTIWELTLKKPYKDGGPATHGTNIPGLKSAVWVDGSLNAPHDSDNGWSVEIAIPWEGLAKYNAGETPPLHGDRWRISFSRVQWKTDVVDGLYVKREGREDNWVWSPQGIVDMHRPERWGIVQFSTMEPGTDSLDAYPEMASRDLLMEVYHAQKKFKEKFERWAPSLHELGLESLRDEGGAARVTGFEADGDGFLVEVTLTHEDGSEARFYTDHESRIWQ